MLPNYSYTSSDLEIPFVPFILYLCILFCIVYNSFLASICMQYFLLYVKQPRIDQPHVHTYICLKCYIVLTCLSAAIWLHCVDVCLRGNVSRDNCLFAILSNLNKILLGENTIAYSEACCHIMKQFGSNF